MNNIFGDFRRLVLAALKDLTAEGPLPAGTDFGRIAIEPPRDPAHGDLATNAAMVLAGVSQLNPMELAGSIRSALAQHELVTGDYRGSGFTVEIARPGFLNIRLEPAVWHAQLRAILGAGAAYGDSTIGNGERINIEFVSANPTGPLHVGHGRGAVVGDVLAALLAKAGFAVHREYYINDAGAQVDALARSLHWRYREALARDEIEKPIGEIPYPGEYLKETGANLARRDGDKWLDQPEAVWLPPLREFAVDEMMGSIKADLSLLGIDFKGAFVSEREFVRSGAVDECLDFLEKAGLTYIGELERPKGKVPDDWEPRPQLLFRATEFGDEVDRPLKKSDGSWTYFSADIAYHRDKFIRGWKKLINIWGVDHGGYVKRMQAAVKALTDGVGELDVKLCNIVNLLDKGVPVQMSKRAGTFVKLRDVIEEVEGGKNVFRFIMLTRRNDHTLDFDFAKVSEHSKENMVFYVQYAHARAASVLRHAKDDFREQPFWEGGPAHEPAWIASLDAEDDASDAEAHKRYQEVSSALAEANLALLSDPAELSLIRVLASWPRIVEAAADFHEPHRVAFYLNDVAAQFHLLWTKGSDEARLRFIILAEPDLTLARLALVRAVAIVIASGLAVIGVRPVEEM